MENERDFDQEKLIKTKENLAKIGGNSCSEN